jgi:opacity protein-like surface antigen
MRKLQIVLLFSLLILLAAASAWAGSLGQPAGLVPAKKWTLSLSGEYFFEQKFKDYDLSRSTSAGVSDTERKSAKFKEDQTYLATLTWGATDWLNLFAQAGWVRGGKWIDDDLATGQQWEAKLKDKFAWGAGLKAKVWEPKPGWQLVLTGRYFRYDDRKVDDWQNTTQGFPASRYWNTDDKLDYWQVDLNAVMFFKLGQVTPFVGAGWSYAEGDFSGRWSAAGAYVDYDSKFKLKDELSALAGLTWEISPQWSISLQGAFVSRTAVTLGLTWTF